MYEYKDMETGEILQIVSVALTVLGFIASEILALCPGVQANGVLHWLKLYVSKSNDIVVTMPENTYELRRRPSVHGDRTGIYLRPSSPQGAPSVYSQVTLKDDVPGQDQ